MFGEAGALPGCAHKPVTPAHRSSPLAMPRYDFRTPRLYVDAPLAAGAEVVFDRNQANYLRNVLRLGQGDAVLLFNGRDGEWQADPVNGAKAQPVGHDRRTTSHATCAWRPALSVCAAQACAPRLHGAEGGGDGGLVPATGDHPAHAGCAGQPRSDAGQCDRGRRAVRCSAGSAGCRSGAARAPCP